MGLAQSEQWRSDGYAEHSGLVFAGGDRLDPGERLVDRLADTFAEPSVDASEVEDLAGRHIAAEAHLGQRPGVEIVLADDDRLAVGQAQPPHLADVGPGLQAQLLGDVLRGLLKGGRAAARGAPGSGPLRV